jgi:hypothetical protein
MIVKHDITTTGIDKENMWNYVYKLKLRYVTVQLRRARGRLTDLYYIYSALSKYLSQWPREAGAYGLWTAHWDHGFKYRAQFLFAVWR